jgi:hypothetical protein
MGRIAFVLATAMLALGLAAAPAGSKPCPVLCKQQIKACNATCTEKPKRPCKRACRKNLVTACKATSDVPKERTCPASPSGAFVE